MLLTQGGVWRCSQAGLQADSHLNQLQGFTNLHDLHLHHQQCLFNIIINFILIFILLVVMITLPIINDQDPPSTQAAMCPQ